MIGVSEALALGGKLGIDQKTLVDIMKVSTSRYNAFLVQTLIKKMLEFG